MIRDREGSERSKRAAEKIRDEGRSLLRMITTLLDIAKADEGQLAPTRSRIELDELVAGVITELDVRAQSAGVRLTRQIDTPTLSADPDLLRRVLENLTENAIRHAPEGSEVRISACASHDGIELRVQDAGVGVPVDQRERVFERFVQAGAETTTRTNRGLGLAFCKVAVEAQGGRIWIEDGSPGAAFCVSISRGD